MCMRHNRGTWEAPAPFKRRMWCSPTSKNAFLSCCWKRSRVLFNVYSINFSSFILIFLYNFYLFLISSLNPNLSNIISFKLIFIHWISIFFPSLFEKKLLIFNFIIQFKLMVLYFSIWFSLFCYFFFFTIL
jgi:hypothetical protein